VLVLAANTEKMNISLEEQSLEERILEFKRKRRRKRKNIMYRHNY
jgi:hypothetical protein